MKKIGTFIFLFHTILLSLQAQTGLQKSSITIQASNISVIAILEAITQQTGYDFSYNPKMIDTEKRISFYVNNKSIEEVLVLLTNNINISYQIIEGQIVLNPSKDPHQHSKDQYTISGFLSDQTTGESLIGASIVVEGSNQGAISNEFGFYSLSLQPGLYNIHFSYVGYQLYKKNISLQKDQKQNVQLELMSILLPNVEVGLSLPQRIEKKQLSAVEFSPKSLESMPEFAGESGLVKGLQSLPGIKMHSDGSAFLYARGGTRDQNLIIIDDAPIYNPSHLFGFYSLVIPDFAKSIKVYKSDIPTNLGDRLSSIVSIRTKDGNLNQLKFSGALNPLINNLYLETPVSKKRGSIFASFRRSNFEWLYQRERPNLDLHFWDFSFKWNHKINAQNRLFFTAILSEDHFVNLGLEDTNSAGIRWGNFAATLRWNHIFGPKLFSNTILYTGNYEYRIFRTPDFWQSRLGTLSLKSDFTYYHRPNFQSKFGLEIQGYFIDPGSFALDSLVSVLPNIEANYSRKLALYYQGNLDISDKLTLNGGVRMVSWENLGPATYYRFDSQFEVSDTIQVSDTPYHRYWRIDPRVSLKYRPNTTTNINLSVGLYHQYLQQISNSVSPFTSMEVWLPASPNIQPQSSFQISLDYLKYYEKPQLLLTGAIYYKKLWNQIDYADHANLLLNPLIEGELRFGQINTYGLELQLKKEYGRFSGLTNYTYARAFRTTPSLNNGQQFPAFQDRPHELSALINFQVSKRFSCSAYWTSFSGATFTAPTGFYHYNGQTAPVYTQKHNDRLPTYNRLDLAVRYRLNKKTGGPYHHDLHFSLFNALGSKNISSVSFNKIPIEGGSPVLKNNLLQEVSRRPTQVDFIRFFPSITYKFQYQ